MLLAEEEGQEAGDDFKRDSDWVVEFHAHLTR
jgi:hypothetical protein